MGIRKSAFIISIQHIWHWLKRRMTGGYGDVTARAEFDKAVLIEKYGFNRYL